jgi:hypothetical protein
LLYADEVLPGKRDVLPSALPVRDRAKITSDRRRNPDIFKEDAMSEKWGQNNESAPLRFTRGGGVYYIFDPDISDILFEKNRI